MHQQPDIAVRRSRRGHVAFQFWIGVTQKMRQHREADAASRRGRLILQITGSQHDLMAGGQRLQPLLLRGIVHTLAL
jgi:hypothetical protein